MRQRGEHLERPFAHLYDTGGMRRTHLRRHDNILKRLLIHASGFNLALVMRRLIGVGTPRGLQGRLAAVLSVCVALWRALRHLYPLVTTVIVTTSALSRSSRSPRGYLIAGSKPALGTTGC